MPWRSKPAPYYVLVSEVMLQQTQVSRVVPKFEQFVQRFPDIKTLAAAPLGNVLAAWSGLGYNRRAKYLWQTARAIQEDHGGKVPKDPAVLTGLPGIGSNTAGAIVAYAYNQPAVFIETNIRSVFIHHFFKGTGAVTDAQIKELVRATLLQTNVRQWYWALMDYGAHLKATTGSSLKQVHGHKPQSRFAGSLRQVRGQVLRLLIAGGLTQKQLQQQINDPRLKAVLAVLLTEELIHKQGERYTI